MYIIELYVNYTSFVVTFEGNLRYIKEEQKISDN